MTVPFFISDVWSNSHQLQLYTDASGASVSAQFLASIGVMVNGQRAGVTATLHFLNFIPSSLACISGDMHLRISVCCFLLITRL